MKEDLDLNKMSNMEFKILNKEFEHLDEKYLDEIMEHYAHAIIGEEEEDDEDDCGCQLLLNELVHELVTSDEFTTGQHWSSCFQDIIFDEEDES